ncbi:MAG: DUF2800 domain-containing protein [Clostridia bacterium]|nr:DUF2800 domain-containing protein [Clostridia bacterium]
MPGVHAVLSASKAKQWLACPPSARLNDKLSERFGEQSSPFAAEGTTAHSLSELKLRHEIGELNDFNFKEQVKALGNIPAEMDRATDYYVDVVLERLYTAQRSCPDAKLFIEQRLDYSAWVPKGFGTGDAVIVSDETLDVCDLKYGKGIPVSAVENPQARLYGLGAIAAFGELYGFTHVRNTIIQPRLDSVTDEVLSREELLEWGESIRPTAELAWKGKGEFVPGDHCRFCNARGICFARASQALSLFKHGFDNPDVLPDDQIPEILKVADVAESWIKDVRAYAYNQALKGYEWPGFKLVRGKRPNRAWRDEEAVKEQLIRAGYEEKDYLNSKLKGVSDIEKFLGKNAFKTFLGAMVSQGEGALTLVPEDDKRIEYASADADFSDITAEAINN